jgi:LuxR family transcriptional regulator of csgAB operon
VINLNGNSSSSRQVTFITHPSIQSKAFASYLSETLMAPVVLQNINKPLAQRLAKDSVILFDIAVSNKKLNGVWRDIIRCRQIILVC